ncbi:MAG: hypothetical protein ABSG24_06850 [Acidimicrobiales bacterium]
MVVLPRRARAAGGLTPAPTRRSTRVTRVYLERGSTWTFASALEWPGWCRRARSEQAAVEELLDYQERYELVVGPSFTPGRLEIIGEVTGNATTDFGAPTARGPWDEESDQVDVRRMVGLLESAWHYLDRVVAIAPPALRKGPRGGGRNRDQVVDHVREAERRCGSKVGGRVTPRTPWSDQRAVIVDSLLKEPYEGAWPASYSIRWMAWHVLDHAWEIEDKSD